MSLFLLAGTAFVLFNAAPDVSVLMAIVSISTDEYLRRNSKWSQAMIGSDRDEWLAADRKEFQQHADKPTFILMSPEMIYLYGTRFLPIKRQCKLKDNGEFKV